MSDLSTWYGVALVALDVFIVVTLIPRIIYQRRDSAATLAWVSVILLFPLGGAVLFHFFGTLRLRRRRRLRERLRTQLVPSGKHTEAMLHAFRYEPNNAPENTVANRVFSLHRSEVTTGNSVIAYNNGKDAFDALEAAILSAKHHIHMEFYIFRADNTGTRLLELLTQKAKEGVVVRLLADSLGSFDLKERYLKELRAAGANVAFFLPINPLIKPFSVNFRNHRKIVVIDGEKAFTGGVNVGDEYRLGVSSEIGLWRDILIQVAGPAALRFQQIFLEDWNFAAHEACNDRQFFPPPTQHGSVAVQVVESGPDATAYHIHRAFFTAITSANQRVWLTTPYFIPDRPILVALQTAALRGVDVRLLVPGHPDHPFVFHAGRSHYQDLLEAGVRVFEYSKGFVHAKTMIVDEAWTTIGSANMDRRSFALNWEANLIAQDPQLTRTMAMTFLRDLEHTTEIKRPLVRSAYRRMKEAFSYLLSPLL